MPTQLLCHSSSFPLPSPAPPKGQEEKKRWKSSWVKIRQGEHSPVTVMGRTDLTWDRLIYCQLIIDLDSEVKKEAKINDLTSPSPSSQAQL